MLATSASDIVREIAASHQMAVLHCSYWVHVDLAAERIGGEEVTGRSRSSG
jgi:hypothetical protein